MRYSVIIASLLLLLGCQEASKTNKTKVIHEAELKADDSLHVSEENVLILSLEHSNAEDNTEDLGTRGEDCFIFEPSRDLNNVTIDIEENSSIAEVSIRDISSDKMAIIDVNEDSFTYTFKADQEYEYCLAHDDKLQEESVVFLYFEEKNSTKRSQGDSIKKLKQGGSCTGKSCDLSNANLTGMDLEGRDLRGAKMHKCVLTNANLKNAKLQGTELSEVALGGADLSGTNIDYSKFSFIKIKGAIFQNTIFGSFSKKPFMKLDIYENIDFTASDLHGQLFQSSRYKDCIFSDANMSQAYLDDSDFSNNIMTAVDLRESSVSDANFSYADLSSMKIDGIKGFLTAIIEGATLRSVNFSGFSFSGMKIEGVDFSNSDMHGADLSSINSILNVNFEGTNLDSADFNNSRIKNSNFSHASMLKVSMKDTYISSYNDSPGNNFSYANLSGVDLSHKELVSINFDHTNLSKANLSNTHITYSKFTNANLSKATLKSLVLNPNNSEDNFFVATADRNSVNFENANLNSAFLSGDLRHVYFAGAFLEESKIYAPIDYSNFFSANLKNITYQEFNTDYHSIGINNTTICKNGRAYEDQFFNDFNRQAACFEKDTLY